MSMVGGMDIGQALDSYADLGFAVISNVLNADCVDALLKATEFLEAGATHSRDGQAYAIEPLF